MFNISGEEFFCFGISFLGKLLYFLKVVVFNNEFFVLDVDKKNNCCMVSVFDYEGKYLRVFGECMLKKDLNECVFYLFVIVLDVVDSKVFVYSGLYKLVCCYMFNGFLEFYYSILFGIMDMVVIDDGRVFVVCGGSGEFFYSVQFIFYY